MPARRKNIMLGTAGHVDHGKTALVKLLTGCETDSLAEEKRRGLTIDLGFAPCRLSDDRVVGVVDVPGHVDFIRNMVAGAHGIDVVILVVAADDGIMPQTREHLQILTLMGLRHGLVALSKIDLVDAARRGSVINHLRGFLGGTFLERAPICPLSNITGDGYDAFFDALNSLVDCCENRSCGHLFRLWVEDVFSIRGSGTVLTGIPSSGSVRPGQEVLLLPSGVRGHVRRMQVYGEDAVEGRAGECVALNVPEIDHGAVQRGMLLCAPDTPDPVTMAEAEFVALASLKEPIKDYQEAHLHVGTASTIARIAMLDTTHTDPGQRQMVQLRLKDALQLAPGERYVLRANVASAGQGGVTTIGGGRILGTSNARLRRHKQWTLDALSARRSALDDDPRWMELMLRESSKPISMAELGRKCLLRQEEAETLVRTLSLDQRVVRLSSGLLSHSANIETIAARLLEAVRQFHGANPQHAGVPRNDLIALRNAHEGMIDAALDHLLKSKRLEFNGAVYALNGWKARLSNQDEQLCENIAAAFKQSGFSSPSLEELAASLRVAQPNLQKAIRLLQERRVLVRLDDKVTLHSDAIDAAKAIVLGCFARKPSFTTMDFRDAVGVSRKFAVPLLDYLDRLRFTVRSGHDRTPGVEARKLMK